MLWQVRRTEAGNGIASQHSINIIYDALCIKVAFNSFCNLPRRVIYTPLALPHPLSAYSPCFPLANTAQKTFIQMRWQWQKLNILPKCADERRQRNRRARGDWFRGRAAAGREERGHNWAAKRMAAAKLMPNPLAIGATSATHV